MCNTCAQLHHHQSIFSMVQCILVDLLVGYLSGFVILLVWVCSMSAACNASHTTGKQTQYQHHDNSTPVRNLGNVKAILPSQLNWVCSPVAGLALQAASKEQTQLKLHGKTAAKTNQKNNTRNLNTKKYYTGTGIARIA